MAIQVNDNFNPRTPKPIDNRYGVWQSGAWRSFNDVEEALDVLENYRYTGLTALVSSGGENKEYWFKDGIADGDFVEKTVDLSNYYTKTELQTPGEAEVHWENIIGTPSFTLQEVTDNGNTTSNAIHVTGTDGIDINIDSLAIAHNAVESAMLRLEGGEIVGKISVTTIGAGIAFGENGLEIGSQRASFNTTVKGLDAINNEEFVTLQQLTNAEPDLSNYIQQGDNVSLLNNDAGYITSADIPAAQTLTWVDNSGTLSISGGNSVVLDGRYSLLGHTHPISDIVGLQSALDGKMNRSNTITSGYGITASTDFSGPVSIELNTGVTDSRYIRKDIDDDNGTNELTVGSLVSGDGEFTGTVTLGSVATGTTDEILLYGPGGVIQRKTLTIAGDFGIANGAGVNQFDVALGTDLLFEGANDTTVSFDPVTNKITISSIPGTGGGGAVLSFNTRTGAVVSVTGDYNTDMVPETGSPTNMYYTNARTIGSVLTGFAVGANTAIVATDTILQAFGKAQGQIAARVPSTRTITIEGTAGNIIVSDGAQSLAANRTWAINLAQSGVTPGTYTKVTVDQYGRVSVGDSLVVADIPNLPASKITSGVFSTARLGSGTASTSTYLRGDGTWATLPSFPDVYTKDEIDDFFDGSEPISGYNKSNWDTAFGWGNHASAGYALASRIITAGNGLTGGGSLTADRTLTLGTPGSVTLASTNAVTATSHTHAFAPGGTTAQYIRGDGSLATLPATPTVNNGLLTLATAGIATGSATFTANQATASTFTVTVPATNIAQGTRTATTVPVTSSTGTGATLAAATTSLAGVMTAADKTKLNGLNGSLYELLSNKATSFATVNNTLYPTTQAVVNYVNSQIPALQTLSLDDITGGGISISGGNTVFLGDLNLDLKQDGNDQLTAGQWFLPYRTASGMSNYPSASVGTGFHLNRVSSESSYTGFDIYKANAQDYLWYKTHDSGSNSAWRILADRDWADSKFIVNGDTGGTLNVTVKNSDDINATGFFRVNAGLVGYPNDVSTFNVISGWQSNTNSSKIAVGTGGSNFAGGMWFQNRDATSWYKVATESWVNDHVVTTNLDGTTMSSVGNLDVDTVTATSRIWTTTGSTNRPVTTSGILTTDYLDSGSGYFTQTYSVKQAGDTPRFFYRMMANGELTSWNEFASREWVNSLPSQTQNLTANYYQIGITGGNTVNVTGVAVTNRPDAFTASQFGVGVYPFSNTTGSVNYPSNATGGGILYNRTGSGSNIGSFMLWKGNSASNQLYFSSGTSSSDPTLWSPWELIASREWVADNYTFNTSQGATFDNALSGHKLAVITSSTGAPDAQVFHGLFIPHSSAAVDYGSEFALRNNAFYFRSFEDSTTALPWLKVASESWVNSQGFLKSADLANYVTTNTFQDGLTGSKIWEAVHVFNAGLRVSDRLNFNSSGYVYPYTSDNLDAGLYGLYSQAKIGHIWSIGTSFKIAADGSDFGGQYGMAYSYLNPAGEGNENGILGYSHQIDFTSNGIINAAISLTYGYIYTRNTGTSQQWNQAYLRSLTSTSFNPTTGVLELNRQDGVTGLNVSLDGRYVPLEVGVYGDNSRASTNIQGDPNFPNGADDITRSGFYRVDIPQALLIHASHTSPGYAFQIYNKSYSNPSLWSRAQFAGSWGDEVMLYDTSNIDDIAGFALSYNASTGKIDWGITDSIAHYVLTPEDEILYVGGYLTSGALTGFSYVNSRYGSSGTSAGGIGYYTGGAIQHGFQFTHGPYSSSVIPVTFTDNLGLGGLKYAADYSASFTNRSLVDKAYVDSVAGGGNYTAGSGISISSNVIAVDSTVVRTTGNQTVGGIKTFSSQISVGTSGGSFISYTGGRMKFSTNVGFDFNTPGLPGTVSIAGNTIQLSRLYLPGTTDQYVRGDGSVATMPSASIFTRTVPGMVPAPGGSGSTRYLREDGSWVVPDSGGGGGTATDLSLGTRTSTTMVINSSTGDAVTLPAATTSLAGLFTAAEKSKLNGIASGANNYTLPIASPTTLGGIKVGGGLAIDGSGVLSATGGGGGDYTGSTSIILTGSSFQRAALTGDVTAALNSNATTIATSAVTYAKFQNVPSQTLLGRGAAGTGNVGAITLGAGLSLTTGGVLSATGGSSVDLVTAGSATVGALRYAGTTKTGGQLYGGTAAPTNSTRLNYDGIIHAFDYISYGTSDINMKENLDVIDNALEKLGSISGYSFDWKSGHDSYKGRDYGVIAQEIESVLPELVKERGGVKGIRNGNGLTALLIQAVKELSAKVLILEGRLA